MIVSCVFLILVWVLLFISIFVLQRKKEIANLRGQTLISMMIFMHVISIGYPNLLTMLSHFKWCFLPSYERFNISLDLLISIMITLLIFIRAVFMYLKANNKVLSNLRGVILTVNLYIGSIFSFCMICFNWKLPPSQFAVLNGDFNAIHIRMPYEVKGIAINVVFFISFLLVNGLREWGAYWEMMGLAWLRIADMVSMGLVQRHYNSSLNLLIQCNIYRSVLMCMNCFVFLWMCDDSKSSCKSDLQMDLRRTSNWEAKLANCFLRFLREKEQKDLADFFKSKIRNNNQVWKYYMETPGRLTRGMQHPGADRGAPDANKNVQKNEGVQVLQRANSEEHCTGTQ